MEVGDNGERLSEATATRASGKPHASDVILSGTKNLFGLGSQIRSDPSRAFRVTARFFGGTINVSLLTYLTQAGLGKGVLGVRSTVSKAVTAARVTGVV